MKLLHLSRKANRESIAKNGLLPSYIKLEHHFNAFKNHGLKDRKCVYTWNPSEGESTDKYIRDMIYCKLFIHPRNDMQMHREEVMRKLFDLGEVEEWEDNKNWVDFSKIGTKLFGESDTYDLYEIDVTEDDSILLDTSFQHAQTSDNDKFASCHMMKEKYEHNDKVLFISKEIISPDKLKIVTSVKTRLYKNDTFGMSYSKNL